MFVVNRHAVADLEAGRIRQGDLPFVAIAVSRQRNLDAVTGNQVRFSGNANYPDVVAQH